MRTRARETPRPGPIAWRLQRSAIRARRCPGPPCAVALHRPPTGGPDGPPAPGQTQGSGDEDGIRLVGLGPGRIQSAARSPIRIDQPQGVKRSTRKPGSRGVVVSRVGRRRTSGSPASLTSAVAGGEVRRAPGDRAADAPG